MNYNNATFNIYIHMKGKKHKKKNKTYDTKNKKEKNYIYPKEDRKDKPIEKKEIKKKK